MFANIVSTAVRPDDVQTRWNKPPVTAIGPLPFGAQEKAKNVQGSGWSALHSGGTRAGALALCDVQNLTQHLQPNQHKQALELSNRKDDSLISPDRKGSVKSVLELSQRAPELAPTERPSLEPQLSGVRHQTQCGMK